MKSNISSPALLGCPGLKRVFVMSAVAALVVFLLGWLLLWLPVAFVVAKTFGVPWSYPLSPDHKMPLLLPLYGVAPPAIWVYSRFLSAGTWADYGWVWNPGLGLAVGIGFGIGALGVALLVMVELVAGWRRLAVTNGAPGTIMNLALVVGGLLAITLFIGGIEELIFRGVMVQGLLAVGPVWGMVLAASGLFAVSHLVWDGPAGIPSLPGLGLMGAVLILARWVNGGFLGLPWGLHTGWIFAIALLDTFQFAPRADATPSWIAGQPDQPLTGLPALALLGLTGLGLWSFHQIF
jgi:hypothetical protein